MQKNIIFIFVFILFFITACTTVDKKDAGEVSIDIKSKKIKTQFLTVGQKAPNFLLPSKNGSFVELESFKGEWVILYFFPTKDLPGCICNETEFTKLLQDFCKIKNAKVLCVSSQHYNQLYLLAKQYKIKATLLSDYDHEVLKIYGAIDNNSGSKEIVRSTFLIAPGGEIAYYWPIVVSKDHINNLKTVFNSLLVKN